MLILFTAFISAVGYPSTLTQCPLHECLVPEMSVWKRNSPATVT